MMKKTTFGAVLAFLFAAAGALTAAALYLMEFEHAAYLRDKIRELEGE